MQLIITKCKKCRSKTTNYSSYCEHSEYTNC